MESPKPFLLLLPPEIILDVLQYLDYCALIHARQTCKALYGIMNSEQFWAALAQDLCSKPGIGRLMYPLGNYSTPELMRWTLRRFRARDRWASEGPSQPLRFRSWFIDGGEFLSRVELFRGGRWLFTMRLDGAAHIWDLERESPRPQFLFDTPPLSSAGPLTRFCIWLDETESELSFRVATCSPRLDSSRICIYQIRCIGLHSSFVVLAPTVIQDDPSGGRIFCSALSERFFLQCFALPPQGNKPKMSVILQLHWYSQNMPHSASKFVETRIESTGLAKAFFVPTDRVVFAEPTFINIYTISLNQGSPPLKLVLTHHFRISQAVHLLSAPFIGSRCTYLVGIYQDTFRRITIKHNHSLPPGVEPVEELGSLGPISPDVRFGPSATIVPQSRTFKIITYEHCVDQASFRIKQYNAPDTQSLSARHLIGFDDSIGRVVLRSNLGQDQLMVLDLI